MSSDCLVLKLQPLVQQHTRVDSVFDVQNSSLGTLISPFQVMPGISPFSNGYRDSTPDLHRDTSSVPTRKADLTADDNGFAALVQVLTGTHWEDSRIKAIDIHHPLPKLAASACYYIGETSKVVCTPSHSLGAHAKAYVMETGPGLSFIEEVRQRCEESTVQHDLSALSVTAAGTAASTLLIDDFIDSHPYFTNERLRERREAYQSKLAFYLVSRGIMRSMNTADIVFSAAGLVARCISRHHRKHFPDRSMAAEVVVRKPNDSLQFSLLNVHINTWLPSSRTRSLETFNLLDMVESHSIDASHRTKRGKRHGSPCRKGDHKSRNHSALPVISPRTTTSP